MPLPIAEPRRVHANSPRNVRFARAALVGPSLDRMLANSDRAAHRANDPVELVHRYTSADDQELVGLLASAVAYGRVDLFKPRLAAFLELLGPNPSAFAREATAVEVLAATRTFQYRMTGPNDLGALIFAGGRLQREHGSMGAVAQESFRLSKGHWREALDRWVETLWDFDLTTFTGQRTPNRRLAHLVASPGGQSACKRLNLYVRWMVRPADGVDVGLWPLPTSALVIPLDTHVHRIAGFLGLTRRTDLSWRTAEEITARLRRLDPDDPVKYDFALSHMGISGDCPSRKDVQKCAPCPLKPVCRLWGENARSGSL